MLGGNCLWVDGTGSTFGALRPVTQVTRRGHPESAPPCSRRTKTRPVEVAHAVDLAAHTGLRLTDVLRLSWSHVGEHAITFATGREDAAKRSFLYVMIYVRC